MRPGSEPNPNRWRNANPATILVAFGRRSDSEPHYLAKGSRRMGKVVVINHLTLDGVMQSPGRPEEDTRDGFTHGGWAANYADEQALAATQARVAEGGGLQLLLGRRSYEEMLGYWNTQDSPFKDALNSAPKYVASRTLRDPVPWPNTTLLDGEVAEAVAQLKRELSGDLTVMGSGDLLRTLMLHDLIDEYLLLIAPVVIGTGRRLFGEGSPSASLRLIDSTTTGAGVIIARYESAPRTAVRRGVWP
jgi:dihydrofolate reductase